MLLSPELLIKFSVQGPNALRCASRLTRAIDSMGTMHGPRYSLLLSICSNVLEQVAHCIKGDELPEHSDPAVLFPLTRLAWTEATKPTPPRGRAEASFVEWQDLYVRRSLAAEKWQISLTEFETLVAAASRLDETKRNLVDDVHVVRDSFVMHARATDMHAQVVTRCLRSSSAAGELTPQQIRDALNNLPYYVKELGWSEDKALGQNGHPLTVGTVRAIEAVLGLENSGIDVNTYPSPLSYGNGIQAANPFSLN